MTEGASIRIAEKSWAPYAAIGLSLLLQLAVWAFWGGGITQRVAAQELKSAEATAEIRELSATLSRQSSAQAVLDSRFGEIIKQLDKISQKLDQPVRIR